MIHTIPVLDIEPHRINDSCGCKPVVTISERVIIVTHNAFDGREALKRITGKGILGWCVICTNNEDKNYEMI